MRYAVRLSYQGKAYHGWQKQPHQNTVQAEIERAFFTVLRVQTPITGSGRTDTGVHSSDQLFHFDSEVELTHQQFYRINKLLPFDIALHCYSMVSADFHARFEATRRAYVYRISRVKQPFERQISYHFHRPLNLEAMNQACQHLMGRLDFEAFSKVKTEVNHFFCDLEEARWEQEEGFVCFHVAANRFLRGMVRALVGSLIEIGLGQKDPVWIKQVLESKDRSMAGRNAPAEGLILRRVEYPTAFNWIEI